MLDRFLVLAESRELPARIIVNKIDLDITAPNGDGSSLAHELFGDYESIYPVQYVSVVTGQGLVEIRAALAGKITAVAGPSGVGKSSLLNTLDPEGARAIGEISEATGKGRHTTTATILRRIELNTYVADTPGIRALALHGVAPEELDQCFPEFRPFLGQCAYFDCSHDHEPACAVIDAVEAGQISRERYESYVSLRRGDQSE
jgi:ribosome biogenesis GTPase